VPPPDLRARVGSLELKNPVIAASGTFGYGIEFAHLVDLNRLGGFVVKGLSAQPMEGAPGPRLEQVAGGMLNAVGLQNIGVHAFIEQKLPLLRRYDTAVIANVFGHDVEEYAGVIQALERAEGLAAYELNVSCPNVARGGLQYGSDPGMTAEVVAAARRHSRRPLWVKLSPNVTDIAAIARAAEAAGADALVIANTYPAMSVDPRTRKSRLGNLTGGLSGPAIKPITLKLVYDAFQAVKIPIVGVGGIETPEDILEYVLVGASAVEVGTAQFTRPDACVRLIEGLEKLCLAYKLNSFNDLKGRLTVEKGCYGGEDSIKIC
jgi:dihydroorotate dehydrogenase (NAD+) catalytic subunit